MDTLDDEEAEEIENQMNADLEILEILEDEGIPFSLEYFLGVNEKDDVDDENEDDDDDSDSEDEAPKKKGKA